MMVDIDEEIRDYFLKTLPVETLPYVDSKGDIHYIRKGIPYVLRVKKKTIRLDAMIGSGPSQRKIRVTTYNKVTYYKKKVAQHTEK